MRRAVIVGRAGCAMDDYAAALALGAYDDVIVIGKMAEAFPDRIDHWVSFHANLFDRWAEVRASRGLPEPTRRWGAIFRGKRLGANVGVVNYVPCVGGSSGYMGVQVALDELGCDRVVLAGMPMSVEGGHYAGAATPAEVDRWSDANTYWATWEADAERMRPRVRSLSGRTRALLGAPTREWLMEA